MAQKTITLKIIRKKGARLPDFNGMCADMKKLGAKVHLENGTIIIDARHLGQ